MRADQIIIDNMAKALDFKYPVKVIFDPFLRDEGKLGTYREPTESHPWHKILIHSDLDTNLANEVFHHEFTHARQFEETGENFRAIYMRRTELAGYEHNDYEIDARKAVQELGHIAVIFSF